MSAVILDGLARTCPAFVPTAEPTRIGTSLLQRGLLKGQQVIANRLDTLPTLKGIKPDFSQIKFVDPGLQNTPVNDLLKKVGSVTEPREALLSADVQNAILAAAQSVAGGSASPQQAADTLEQAAEAAANQ